MGNELKYEWNIAYRLDHWIRVISIAVLVFTGFYIHWPFITGGAESFVMSWMRFAHTVSAYALILGLIVRIYMAFKSSFDSDWKDFGIGKNLKALPEILSYYLFMKGTHAEYRKYNPLQAFAYLSIGLLIIFISLTGVAIHSGKLFAFINARAAFGWVNTLLGGESYTRIWHFLSMWAFIIFVGVHVYMTVLQGAVNKDKTFSSIFTGYKIKRHS